MSPKTTEELSLQSDEDSEPKILEEESTEISYKPNSCRFCAGSKFC